ncbi:lymphocyte function-associated antigen 3 isoform X2 [Phalacrocorax aristotelis]|uniref:lymphocyte function-associated antigen 3 isoform X2 n=1 Tax=Phalacrocorax aristotelis TaxID=126867 RepID=UPI003F4BCD8D
MRLLFGLRFLFFGFFLAHVRCEEVFGIVGENFTFPVKIDQKIEEIIWTKNKDKVAEWDRLTEVTYFNSLLNRSLLNKENGCLTVFNLQDNDAGTYKLDYVDSQEKNSVLTFILAVLATPSKPEISCNISGGNIVLRCAADFPKPLNYAWKFSSKRITRQTQEVFIPKKDVDASEKASCFIKFSQTEKSSEISLTQCFPDEKDSYHDRGRYGLIVIPVVIFVAAILGYVCKKARTKSGTQRAAQKNSPACSSGEHQPLCSMDGEDQSNSRDKELNKEDSDLKDKQKVNNGVNQEELSTKQKSTPMSNCAVDRGVTEGDTSKKENNSSLANHPGDYGVNERGSGKEHEDSVDPDMEERGGVLPVVLAEVIQAAESGNGEHLSNSPSSSKEELKSQPNNCFVGETMTEEKK